MMIRIKLLLAEYMAEDTKQVDKERIKAIKCIKKLLSNNDIDAESIPLDNEDRLIKLLASLKGESLSKEEKELTQKLLR